jgi:hypothetical protein
VVGYGPLSYCLVLFKILFMPPSHLYPRSSATAYMTHLLLAHLYKVAAYISSPTHKKKC